VVPARELRYRDYRIKIMRSDRGWQIEAVPLSRGKTILQLFSFSDDIASDEDAIGLARSEIDKILEFEGPGN
jgi:hypothetical protein